MSGMLLFSFPQCSFCAFPSSFPRSGSERRGNCAHCTTRRGKGGWHLSCCLERRQISEALILPPPPHSKTAQGKKSLFARRPHLLSRATNAAPLGQLKGPFSTPLPLTSPTYRLAGMSCSSSVTLEDRAKREGCCRKERGWGATATTSPPELRGPQLIFSDAQGMTLK